MAYEVTKTIRGREYRYEVESYRDPETGKVRNKWRYIGRADGNRQPRRRVSAGTTRQKLVEGLERLLETSAWNDVTANAIAREAGVTEATLYRYFHSRTEVLDACLVRVKDDLNERLTELRDIADSPAEEKARFREWTIEMVKNPPGGAVLFALWVSGGSEATRRERHALRRATLISYLEELVRRQYTVVPQHQLEDIATALALLVQAFSYRTVIERKYLGDEEYASLAVMIERIVFG